MHIRRKAADGSFRGIFVSDDRDPNESLQYSAATGFLLQRAGSSYLVLSDGVLIRRDRVKADTSVVDFQTYAIDLSQLGEPSTSAIYEAQERSTLYLLEPDPSDKALAATTRRVAFELHNRIAAPLYTLAFAFIALAFLGRPRTNRQDRTFAITACVMLCIALRTAGFAVAAIGTKSTAAIPFLYAIPLFGIAFGLAATMLDARLQAPRFLEAAWERAGRALRRRERSDLAEVGAGLGGPS